MKAWEFYYKEVERINKISIKDNSNEQQIMYMNRLIDKPIRYGAVGGSSENIDNGVVGGSGIFSGKSDAEKLKMCGVNGDWSPQSALSRGLITDVTVPCSPGTIKFNKYAANDLVAILNEIKSQLTWFTLRISSAFRTLLSAGGHSRHQVGLAVDINAGSYANPWFAGIGKKYGTSMPTTEPAQGSAAPWPCKKYSAPPYDRTKCIWHWGHPVVKIFQSHGWGWGGSYGDVMHFSIDGH